MLSACWLMLMLLNRATGCPEPTHRLLLKGMQQTTCWERQIDGSKVRTVPNVIPQRASLCNRVTQIRTTWKHFVCLSFCEHMFIYFHEVMDRVKPYGTTWYWTLFDESQDSVFLTDLESLLLCRMLQITVHSHVGQLLLVSLGFWLLPTVTLCRIKSW